MLSSADVWEFYQDHSPLKEGEIAEQIMVDAKSDVELVIDRGESDGEGEEHDIHNSAVTYKQFLMYGIGTEFMH